MADMWLFRKQKEQTAKKKPKPLTLFTEQPFTYGLAHQIEFDTFEQGRNYREGWIFRILIYPFLWPLELSFFSQAKTLQGKTPKHKMLGYLDNLWVTSC